MMLTEFKGSNSLLHHEVTNYQSLQYLLHSHTTYEFYYFVQGNVEYCYRGQQIALKPHSLIFLHPNTEHGYKILNSETYERYVLQFDPSIVAGGYNKQLLSLVDARIKRELPIFEFPPDNGVKALMEQFLDCTWIPYKKKAELIPQLIHAILTHLLFQKPVSGKSIFRDMQPNQAIEHKNTMDEVVYWINSNITSPITVEQVAKQFYIAKNTLNRNFQSMMGMSVRDYIRTQRVDLARHLIEEGCPATIAATQAGFKDYSTFYRAYVKFLGHSPATLIDQSKKG